MSNVLISERVKEITQSLEKHFSKKMLFKALFVRDVKEIDDNNFLLTAEVTSTFDTSMYQMFMFHSEDGFKTRKARESLSLVEGDLPKNELDDLIGSLYFYINSYCKFAFLSGIQVGEQYYGKGYGSCLIKHFKYLLKNNLEINKGTKLSYINGKFVPCGERSVSDVQNFYLRNGADPKVLGRVAKIRIKLTDQDEK